MGRALSWANAWAAFGDAMRRRVNSPSWATSTTLVPVTAVFGSTKISTPRRAAAHSPSSTATALRSDRLSRDGSSGPGRRGPDARMLDRRPAGRSQENMPIIDSRLSTDPVLRRAPRIAGRVASPAPPGTSSLPDPRAGTAQHGRTADAPTGRRRGGDAKMDSAPRAGALSEPWARSPACRTARSLQQAKRQQANHEGVRTDDRY